MLYIGIANFAPTKWWVKPTAANPLTDIAFDGTFIVDYTTGGIDETAIGFHAFLIPRTYSPPVILGASSLPQELFDNSVADVLVAR